MKNKNWFYAAVSALFIYSFFGCVKREFDEPPVGGEPVSVKPNISIAELKKLHVTPGGFDTIKQDLIIGGVVVMDDRSGNYYKSLVIQDSSGGIEVRFNDGFLYNQFPIGRQIFIYCKDLILTDYNNLTQLTGSVVEQGGVLDDVGLTEAQVRRKIVKGPMVGAPTPRTLRINELNNSHISTLIRLEQVQFIAADTGKTYAEPITKNSLNRTLIDCSGNKLILRSSGYADFAGQRTPAGNGSIVGVLSIFGTTLQMYIRDLNDVKMTGARCSGVGGQLMNIRDLRSLFTGSTMQIPADRKIRGIVISDRIANNTDGRNLFVQSVDGSAGIVVRFTANHSYNLGDEVEVDVSNMELSQFNGLLQVNNVPVDRSAAVASGRTPAVRTATVAQINANGEQWESTLVRITGATISGAGTALSGTKTVSDATGSIPMFTRTAATFANAPTPAGTVSLTAIVSEFNGRQIILRNLNDIQP
ncbi:MAG: DUF5689 domain-containing protein [Saprospiraceae bacterium]|nr:DUF5689 domain-containing protein [Saprospiraceae bacterium]MDW8483029.1 DUF5689 domain-containing protein [Saprospiraceae bacterium]